MTIKEFIRKKVLGMIGLAKSDGSETERLTFINDAERITKTRIKEYDIWYYGDSDELLNFYTRENLLNYNFEPWYSRNKRAYFWTVSSTESDIKRTHSGQPRNIVDTLVTIVKWPTVRVDHEAMNDSLKEIIKKSRIKQMFKNQQLPLTLVEGWGCYKISWDKDMSDYPFVSYYRAENVDFIYKNNQITGVVFKDYYTDGENRRYLVIETRSLKYDKEKDQRYTCIEKEVFRVGQNNDYGTKLEPDDIKNIPELSGVDFDTVIIDNYEGLLAVPCILFENTENVGGYGKSIFTGKVDLFDDLDQCLSQSANAVRYSTPIEYYNSDFLERDPKTGMPRQPKRYNRAYSVYNGQKDADGVSTSGDPVHVTQPSVDFSIYSKEAVAILLQIINGILSPATLGIDIAKKDNAEAQREKEKVTIFTRNAIIDSEIDILEDLFNQLLCAYELMHNGKISCDNYKMTIKFSEFADDSYENKLEKLGQAFDNELISEEMYIDKLYGDSLSEKERDKELKWLKENHTKPKVDGLKTDRKSVV